MKYILTEPSPFEDFDYSDNKEIDLNMYPTRVSNAYEK